MPKKQFLRPVKLESYVQTLKQNKAHLRARCCNLSICMLLIHQKRLPMPCFALLLTHSLAITYCASECAGKGNKDLNSSCKGKHRRQYS